VRDVKSICFIKYDDLLYLRDPLVFSSQYKPQGLAEIFRRQWNSWKDSRQCISSCV